MPATDLAPGGRLLVLRLGLRELLHRARDRSERSAPDARILLLAGGLALVAALLWSVAEVAGLCRGSGDGTALLLLGGASVLAAGRWRGIFPHLPDLRALPGGTGMLAMAGLGWGLWCCLPVALPVLAGTAWAVVDGAPGVALARGAALLGGCFALSWAAAIGRSWPALAAGALGCACLAAVAAPHPLLVLCGPLAVVALLPVLGSVPPAASARQRGWRPGIISQILAEHPREVLVRLCLALGLGLLGFRWWMDGRRTEVHPGALVLIAGLAGLACDGMVHLASDFRAGRLELMPALPIGRLRWAAVAMAAPATVQLLAIAVLSAAAVGAGAPPALVMAAAGVAVLTALARLGLHLACPAHGGALAAALTVGAARAVAAVGRP